MNNVFMTHLKIHERYDLKGSTIDRAATEKEKQKPNPILKDLDIKTAVYIGKEKTEKVRAQIALDCAFLEENNIMDYSLLLGVHNTVTDEDATEVSSDSSASISTEDFRRRRYSLPLALPNYELSSRSKRWLERRKRKQYVLCKHMFLDRNFNSTNQEL